MADNYLENRYEETHGNHARKVVVKRVGPSLDTLLKSNRSYRGYDAKRAVPEETLKKIVSVNCWIPSARNQQALRFKTVFNPDETGMVLRHIKLGAALPQLHLPFPGTEPQAFIIVCSTMQPNPMLYVDAGISVQSMLLKAVELGLNGLVIAAFNKAEIRIALQLPYDPLLIVAIGKGAENIQCVPIEEKESHAYYRQDGVHYVPKLQLDTLLIP